MYRCYPLAPHCGYVHVTKGGRTLESVPARYPFHLAAFWMLFLPKHCVRFWLFGVSPRCPFEWQRVRVGAIRAWRWREAWL